MFRVAYSIASEFTFPIALFRTTLDGQCSSGIGTYVVINKDGWIVTAAHIIHQLSTLESEKKAAADHDKKYADLQADTALTVKERRNLIKNLNWPAKDSTKDYAVWFGGQPGSATSFTRLDAVDIAVGRLDPFDATTIKNYPVFKDPSKDFDPGTSLCKLGFPLREIKVAYDPIKGFEVAPDAFPIPRFPIDGILTRMANVTAPAGVATTYPLELIETSSPGLRGQSGGPTFDKQGAIWGIQVRTSHYPLGFDTGKTEQFLNVGLGASVSTLLPFFDSLGITYAKSTY